jgi:hypothetical protein
VALPDKTKTATWVRVSLAAPADQRGPHGVSMTEGELVLRADRVQVQEDTLLFLVGDDVVFRLDRRFFRALTWFVDRPTFGEWLKARRKQYPNANRRWGDEEITQLRGEVGAGLSWPEIGDRHGRTANAVQDRANWLGLTTSKED